MFNILMFVVAMVGMFFVYGKDFTHIPQEYILIVGFACVLSALSDIKKAININIKNLMY